MSELTLSPELLQISAEVQDALKNKKPVVALESTIISHGMPFPQNAQTAIEVEETIRKFRLRLPMSFFSEERKGDIIARMSGDVGEVENSITG